MKLKNRFFLAAAAALLSACSADYLDTLPQSSTDTGTVFETTENARMAVNGLCLMMTQQYLGQQGVNGEGTIKTWYGNYPGNDFQKCNLTGWAPIINATYMERNSVLYCYYPWFYYYKLVGNANRILANIDKAVGAEEERLFIRAQALTVRAYAYLMLSQLYCHRWADSNQGASRGLPLRIDTSDGDLPASTLAQVYTQIYTDLDAAIDGYTRSGLTRPRDDNHSPDLAVAYAIYARAALTREDWAAAAKYAPLARKDYPLMSNADYVDGGFSTPNREWIWSSYSAPDQTLYYFSFFAQQGSNSSANICRSYPCAISKELYYRIPATDVRRRMFLAPQEGDAYNTANGRVTAGPLLDRARRDYASKLLSSRLIYAYMQFKFLCLHQDGRRPAGRSQALPSHRALGRRLRLVRPEALAPAHRAPRPSHGQLPHPVRRQREARGRQPVDVGLSRQGGGLQRRAGQLHRVIELLYPNQFHIFFFIYSL